MNPLRASSLELPRQPGKDGSGTRLVGALTILPSLIRQLGADPASVFADANMGLDDLGQSGNRVPHENLMHLFNVAAQQTNCPHFGLLAGQAWHLSDLGLVGEIMSNSRTVGLALQELVLFQHLNSDVAAAFLLQSGDSVDLGYTFYVPQLEKTSQFYDAVLAAAVNFMRELCGEKWIPAQVLLPHFKPIELEPYRRHFRASLHFDSTICALRFPSKYLRRPVPGAKEDRHRLALRTATEAQRNSFVDMVSRALRTLLLQGAASGTEVAQSLAMHRRTLNRRLKEHDTTFQQILDTVRFTVAKELLESSGVSLEEIASALGYGDIVSFIRAFKRWTGLTPGAWRVSLR
jgi:AraC-like DNA-binding protein